MLTTIKNLIRNTRGVTAVEYGLIAALMAAVLIAAVPYVTGGLQTAFNNIGSSLNTVPTTTKTPGAA